MKLLCSCGHPNLLHFAGTGHCHASHPDYSGTTLKAYIPDMRCSCREFVFAEALELVRERKDTA